MEQRLEWNRTGYLCVVVGGKHHSTAVGVSKREPGRQERESQLEQKNRNIR